MIGSSFPEHESQPLTQVEADRVRTAVMDFDLYVGSFVAEERTMLLRAILFLYSSLFGLSVLIGY